MQISEQYQSIVVKRHMTVRIPRGMAETVEDFLNTKQAASMGFDSKADFITAAVRHLLMEYRYYDALTKKIDEK